MTEADSSNSDFLHVAGGICLDSDRHNSTQNTVAPISNFRFVSDGFFDAFDLFSVPLRLQFQLVVRVGSSTRVIHRAALFVGDVADT